LRGAFLPTDSTDLVSQPGLLHCLLSLHCSEEFEGLNCVPPKFIFQSPNSVPQYVTVFEDEVFREVTKVK
jgi:hypothetical protein